MLLLLSSRRLQQVFVRLESLNCCNCTCRVFAGASLRNRQMAPPASPIVTSTDSTSSSCRASYQSSESTCRSVVVPKLTLVDDHHQHQQLTKTQQNKTQQNSRRRSSHPETRPVHIADRRCRFQLSGDHFSGHYSHVHILAARSAIGRTATASASVGGQQAEQQQTELDADQTSDDDDDEKELRLVSFVVHSQELAASSLRHFGPHHWHLDINFRVERRIRQLGGLNNKLHSSYVDFFFF